MLYEVITGHGKDFRENRQGNVCQTAEKETAAAAALFPDRPSAGSQPEIRPVGHGHAGYCPETLRTAQMSVSYNFV